MAFQDLIIPGLSFLTIMSVLLLCYAPAKNHLRYKRSVTLAIVSAVCVLMSVATYICTAVFSQDFGIINTLGVILLFIMYYRSLTLHISQATAIFLSVCAYITFLANFSIIFDALMHPDGKLVDYSLDAFVFLFVLCVVFCCVFIYPLGKNGAFLLDNLPHPRVWWMLSVVFAIFYLFNLRMVIHHYSTLHTNKVGIAYITAMLTMFVLLIMLCIIFYFIAKTLIEKSETENRNRILKMQEKQYESLQRYIDADARVRHDFRQTIYTLKELSAEKDYQAIDDYLNRFAENLPQKETTDYCREPALNALLNHYAGISGKHGIKINIRVAIPDKLAIDNIDLCSIIGNILENAVIACLDIPEDKRFIRVNLSIERDNELYIAISNSFSGHPSMKDGRYLSTHTGGAGIGLISISATAERYNGSANFKHDNDVFYSNIMLVNDTSQPR